MLTGENEGNRIWTKLRISLVKINTGVGLTFILDYCEKHRLATAHTFLKLAEFSNKTDNYFNATKTFLSGRFLQKVQTLPV